MAAARRRRRTSRSPTEPHRPPRQRRLRHRPRHRGVTVTSSIVSGQQLSGTLSWTASVNDGTASSVEFRIDGSNRWTEINAPYQFNGDPNGRLATTTLTNGGHVLAVIARTRAAAAPRRGEASRSPTEPHTAPSPTRASSRLGFTVTSSIGSGQQLTGTISWTASVTGRDGLQGRVPDRRTTGGPS